MVGCGNGMLRISERDNEWCEHNVWKRQDIIILTVHWLAVDDNIVVFKTGEFQLVFGETNIKTIFYKRFCLIPQPPLPTFIIKISNKNKYM